MAAKPVRNLIVFSDSHCGCRLALCPPDGIYLDDGGRYLPSAFQKKLWHWWREFWDVWVPEVTRGEPYVITSVTEDSECERVRASADLLFRVCGGEDCGG